MSDELIKSLNGRIAQLEQDKAGLQVALQGERKDRKALKAELESTRGTAGTEAESLKKQLDDTTKDRDAWQQKATAAPTEQAARISELETTLRTRDHRDTFDRAVGKDLAEGVTVEDLWHFGQFDPAKVERLDPQQITDLVGKVKEAKPVLFVKPGAGGNPANAQSTVKSPLRTTTDASRGARDTASDRVTYTRKEVQAAGWMNTPRGKLIIDARKAGTAEEVDE